MARQQRSEDARLDVAAGEDHPDATGRTRQAAQGGGQGGGARRLDQQLGEEEQADERRADLVVADGERAGETRAGDVEVCLLYTSPSPRDS